MLFGTKDIPSAHPEAHATLDSPEAASASGTTIALIGTRGQKLKEALAHLKPDEHRHFPSYAMWSSHEVLRAILEIIGPAQLHLTTWSIAENPVRQLVAMRDAGMITDITMLLHERSPKNHPAAWQLVQHAIPKVRLVKIHAKILVLQNKDWGVNVVTTANLNRNKNIEYYVVATHRHLAEHSAKWITEIYERGNPFS